ncbi:Hypp846 [Branchiostoma lanceolatum]|uniref:Hypp846 protein n=1 Tax=Branchiostoma lanceolatum TaxID=7740 RepID=A0A8J9W5L8_BRALA|nr:Hypp846 [Branchiostoma lanceolatum]
MNFRLASTYDPLLTEWLNQPCSSATRGPLLPCSHDVRPAAVPYPTRGGAAAPTGGDPDDLCVLQLKVVSLWVNLSVLPPKPAHYGASTQVPLKSSEGRQAPVIHTFLKTIGLYTAVSMVPAVGEAF